MGDMTEIPIELEDSELLFLAKEAHQQGVTLNEKIKEIVMLYLIKELQRENSDLRERLSIQDELVADNDRLRAELTDRVAREEYESVQREVAELNEVLDRLNRPKF